MTKPSAAEDDWASHADEDDWNNLLSTLDLDDHELLHWFYAFHAMDKKNDVQPLLKLLVSGLPERFLPFLADLLEMKFNPPPRRRGRRGPPLYALTFTAIVYHHACEDMRELVNEGQSKEAAAAIVAKAYGLIPTTLLDVYSGKSGYGRQLRRRYALMQR
jgi:hypothetical protein